jgi:hypothetical protein
MPRATKPASRSTAGAGDKEDFNRNLPEYQPPNSQLSPLDEKEIDAAIIASAGGEGVSAEIAGQILRGTTLEEILGQSDPTESLVGVIFKLKSVKWGRSKFPNGTGKSGAFAILTVMDLDGRERTVTSGSPNIMAALRAFARENIDVPALTVRSSETSNGYTVYRFAQPNTQAA